VVPSEKRVMVEPGDYTMVCMRFCVFEDEAWVSIFIVILFYYFPLDYSVKR